MPMISFKLAKLSSNRISLSKKLVGLQQKLLNKLPTLQSAYCVLYPLGSNEVVVVADSNAPQHPSTCLPEELAQLLTTVASAEVFCLENDTQVMIIPITVAEECIGFNIFVTLEKQIIDSALQVKLFDTAINISTTVVAEITAVKTLHATAFAAKQLTKLRDFETGEHLTRMAHICSLIARKVQDTYQLSDEFIEFLFMFASLHDIGKVGIPDRILLKEGRLDAAERKIMETHVEKGVFIIENVIECYELLDEEATQVLRDIVAYHHEYLDGSGYPNGLIGDQVPIAARIVTVADIFDALTNTRPYKQDWSEQAAINELLSMANNGKVDIHCVNGLVDSLDEATRINLTYQDE